MLGAVSSESVGAGESAGGTESDEPSESAPRRESAAAKESPAISGPLGPAAGVESQETANTRRVDQASAHSMVVGLRRARAFGIAYLEYERGRRMKVRPDSRNGERVCCEDWKDSRMQGAKEWSPG